MNGNKLCSAAAGCSRLTYSLTLPPLRIEEERKAEQKEERKED